MKWMAFQKAISVDTSHTSVAESIKLDAMGTCDVCDMYVRMYVRIVSTCVCNLIVCE